MRPFRRDIEAFEDKAIAALQNLQDIRLAAIGRGNVLDVAGAQAALQTLTVYVRQYDAVVRAEGQRLGKRRPL
jgi:hypothetical protein